MKNTITDINTLEGINSWLSHTEEIDKLEDKSGSQTEKERKTKMRTVSKTSERTSGIHILGVPEGEKREKVAKTFLNEIVAENFPILEKKTDILIQKVKSLKQDESKDIHSKSYPN